MLCVSPLWLILSLSANTPAHTSGIAIRFYRCLPTLQPIRLESISDLRCQPHQQDVACFPIHIILKKKIFSNRFWKIFAEFFWINVMCNFDNKEHISPSLCEKERLNPGSSIVNLLVVRSTICIASNSVKIDPFPDFSEDAGHSSEIFSRFFQTTKSFYPVLLSYTSFLLLRFLDR